jgi:hypothetical protein
MKKLLTTLSLAAISLAAANAQIVQWTFTGNSTAPSTGSGTASLIGGTTASFASGSTGNTTTNPAWNTTNYPTQSNLSGTAGVQFLFSTVGFSSIQVSFEHRASGTASRWAQVDYTLNGGTDWVTGFWNNNGALSPHDTFSTFDVDFSSITGANNNSGFGFRIVSIFSPLGFQQNSTSGNIAANTAYMRANSDAVYTPGTGSGTGNYGSSGTWRFDNVTAVPEPATWILVTVGAMAIMVRRKLGPVKA